MNATKTIDLPLDLHKLILQSLATGREKDSSDRWHDITPARRLELQQLIDGSGIKCKNSATQTADIWNQQEGRSMSKQDEHDKIKEGLLKLSIGIVAIAQDLQSPKGDNQAAQIRMEDLLRDFLLRFEISVRDPIEVDFLSKLSTNLTPNQRVPVPRPAR